MYRSIVVAALGLLAVPLAAGSATHATATALDEHYLVASMQGDRFEIQGGTIALANGACPAVKNLGARLKKDHSKSLAEDTTLARRLGVEVPKTPTPSQQWELQQVGSMTGATFDKAYGTLEVHDHIEDIQNTTEEVSKGQTAAIRASAKTELPILRVHLALSRSTVKTCSA
jgi:predicted outer membrane protein